MPYRALIATAALAAALTLPVASAQAFDESKYPDWSGAWRRIAVPGVTGQPGYDQTKRLGRAQQAPLTPEATAIMEASIADQAKGGQGNYPTYTCLSPGMPRIMTPYGMMEMLITPDTTHVLLEHVHDSRRIYTDGRDWPTNVTRSASGSIRTATAATTRSRSKPATCAARAPSTPAACRCTPTTRPS